jgi:hypothetical protein
LGIFITLETGIQYTKYTALNLIPGTIYTFTISARNIQGYSFESNAVSILAAQEPDAPIAPTTTVNQYYVDISWIEPNL